MSVLVCVSACSAVGGVDRLEERDGDCVRSYDNNYKVTVMTETSSHHQSNDVSQSSSARLLSSSNCAKFKHSEWEHSVV